MSRPRTFIGLATLALCSITYAVAPALQGMVQAAPQHNMIQQGTGEWAGTVTMYMEGQASTAPCSEVVASIGDLWTTSRFEMEFMGTTFTGASTLGYDPAKKKFVGTWIDNGHPTLTVMEGTYDEAKKAIVMHYDGMDDMTGTMKKMRQETTHTKNSYTMKFFKVEGGADKLEMEMTLNRKASTTEAASGR
ncbi:MAG: hypothetical protein ACI8QZ_001309 [Chlamydiales bacterium]|jgi:hypothetical protein